MYLIELMTNMLTRIKRQMVSYRIGKERNIKKGLSKVQHQLLLYLYITKYINRYKPIYGLMYWHGIMLALYLIRETILLTSDNCTDDKPVVTSDNCTDDKPVVM